MKYLMLVCVDEATELPAEERATIGPEVDAWISEKLGLLVFACDMYGKAVIGDRERVLICLRELVADRAKISQRVQAGVDVLLSHPLGNGQVAAIGYCFGGRAVLELARTGAQLAGAISVHGSVESAQPARAGDVKAWPKSLAWSS